MTEYERGWHDGIEHVRRQQQNGIDPELWDTRTPERAHQDELDQLRRDQQAGDERREAAPGAFPDWLLDDDTDSEPLARPPAGPPWPGPCPCECNSGGFCGGCGHAGCGGRRP
jgi:hypothetical protein